MHILYEDNHLIAINKEAGVLTHSDDTGDRTATDEVKAYIKEKYNKPGDVFLNPVHRLDRPVSGLLLFAKTSKATSRMVQIFKERETKKTYVALTNRQPQKLENTITHHLKKNGGKNMTYATKKTDEGSKKSVLSYRLIGSLDRTYMFKIEPETGRSHQIRVQMSEVGAPIIGDLKYGSKLKTDGKLITLHAFSLEFIHPVKKELLKITCPIPKNEFWRNFQHLDIENL